MDNVHRKFYSFIKPNSGEHGISFVYDLRIEPLPPQRRSAVIREIKALNMPVWINLLSSDAIFEEFFGRKKVHGQTEFSENDEVYLAMLPGEMPESAAANHNITKVDSQEKFAAWAKIANDALADGRPDMHPVHHYPLVRDGLMDCYIFYADGVPASVAATMNDGGNVSLEFVSTVPEMRRLGYARAVCKRDVSNAFNAGVRIVTVRAIEAIASRLYQSIGFTPYNHAI